MAWKFNPFTGTLDLAGSGSGGATSVGMFQSFVVGDWVINGGLYDLIITHNLNTNNPVTNIYDGATQTFVDQVNITSLNQLTIKASAPFDGTVVVIKP